MLPKSKQSELGLQSLFRRIGLNVRVNYNVVFATTGTYLKRVNRLEQKFHVSYRSVLEPYHLVKRLKCIMLRYLNIARA